MNYPLERLSRHETPFYYYDMGLLDRTLVELKSHLQPNFYVHYALKACAVPLVLERIRQAGLGCDCVSGGEILACLDAGFVGSDIVYAGVGKSDWEINLALDADIFCFNVESLPELEVINQIACEKGKIARVAFRINPNVGVHTHANITTGLSEHKFGIDMKDMEDVICRAYKLTHVRFIGLHFHVGSQILEMDDFVALSHRINDLQERLECQGIVPKHINVGGGLGIDYISPEQHPIANFKDYFSTYAQHLQLRPGQQLHFELGRAIVGQCGSLVTRTLYVKSNAIKQFCIVDAGMTDLLRPALYHAKHAMRNLSNEGAQKQRYDVVGPICESSDVFAKDYELAEVRRGDLIVIQSAGAYGQVMASQYNCRTLPAAYSSETI